MFVLRVRIYRRREEGKAIHQQIWQRTSRTCIGSRPRGGRTRLDFWFGVEGSRLNPKYCKMGRLFSWAERLNPLGLYGSRSIDGSPGPYRSTKNWFASESLIVPTRPVAIIVRLYDSDEEKRAKEKQQVKNLRTKQRFVQNR